MIELAPSILTADFRRLGSEIEALLAAKVERVHFDVMDGRFVPNISFGPALIAALTPAIKQASVVTEAHLMILEPERYLAEFIQAGCDVILVHVETCPHLHRTLQSIRELGGRPGVVINPATPLAAIEEILPDVDQALVMSVNPGFGGQEFIAESLDKIRRLKQLIEQRGLKTTIEVDGGVHANNIAAVAQAGVRVAVTGSAVFNRHGSVAQNVTELRTAAKGR